MKIIKENRSVIEMIDELLNDLLNPGDLRAISRMPEPKGGFRYRNILKRLFLSLGSFQAIVVIQFKNGLKKYYVFFVKAIVSEDAKDFIDCPVEAWGYIVERKDSNITYREFDKDTLTDVEKLYQLISEVGDKFRWSDLEIYLKSISEYNDLFWL